jgi:DNA-binding CsgD family transcriptional regulator
LAARLSPRETQILRLAALGQTSKEMAADLDIRERTVNWHLSKVFRKLGVESRTEAVVLALERGLIRAPHSTSHQRANRLNS